MDTKIDYSKWNRYEIYDFYGHVTNPLYCVSFRQDVTVLYYYCKNHNISFYYSLIYLCTIAINDINEFLVTIRDDGAYRVIKRIPSFTYKKNDYDYFQIITTPFDINYTIEEFNKIAKDITDSQECFIRLDKESDSMIYFSCLPWIDLTGLTNESDILSLRHNCDSIPRIAWGKYVFNNNKIEVGMSMEVNHRLIDGYHIGLFVEKLSKLINDLDKN